MIKIINTFFNWGDVRNISRSTVRKKDIDSEVTGDFKTKLIISEHSPIRELRVRFLFSDIKSWIATHFSRHSWESYITTQRSDRTKVDRDQALQSVLVNLHGSMNAQHLIDTSRKRLCYQSSKETRQLMEGLKEEVEKIDSIISLAMVPNCVYRLGCPEFNSCGLFRKFMGFSSMTPYQFSDLYDIKERYDLYNLFLQSTQL